ncbi:MAG: leucine-rich repeat protein [Lachnospiraceae bacterium]|nr:leucine-rich repeat protein [Lachnospiraceae bacterium]
MIKSRKKKFVTCFGSVMVLALCVQVLGDDLPLLGEIINIHATAEKFSYQELEDGIEITKYSGDETKVSIPEILDGNTVTSIGSMAFSEQSDIESIEIPETVKSIGSYAFANTGLKEIVIPDTVEKMGSYAFFDCENLESVKISSAITMIEENTFEGCALKEVNIPEGVVQISTMAFSDCKNLETVTLPVGLETIGQYAFDRCKSLKSIDIPNSTVIIGAYAFKDCEVLEDVALSSDITIINDGLFENCKNIKIIDIPNDIQIIGVDAFSLCTSLKEITLSDNVKMICDRAFLGCEGLDKVTLGKGIDSIGISAFRNCNTLETITINDAVKSIGENAFYDCHKLTDIRLRNTSLNEVGNGAFYEIDEKGIILVPKGTLESYKKLINVDENLTEGVEIVEVSSDDEFDKEYVKKEIEESEVPAVSEPTKEPEVTEAPTKEPEVTEAPTKEPEVTEAPTKEPEVTKTPEKTKEPTKEPEVTAVPTKEPKVTETPTKEPKKTKEPTKEPKKTKEPTKEPTKAPEVTKAPEKTAKPVEQYKVTYYRRNGDLYDTQYVDKGGKITLKESVKTDGRIFAGWVAKSSQGNVFLPAKAEYKPTGNTVFEEVSIKLYMLNGAAIKLKSTTGLRFSSRVDISSYNEISKYATTFEYGTLVCASDSIKSTDRFTKELLAKDGVKYMEIPTKVWYSVTDTYREFTGVITNITGNNFEKKFSARAYLSITYTNGATENVYADFSETNSRSVKYVAQAAFNDKNVYSKKQMELLKSFTD